MIAEGGGFASEKAQHPQFGCVRVENGLYQSAHGEVTRVQNKGIRIFFFGLIDEGFDLGEPSQSHVPAIFPGEETVQMGMGIVQEKNIYLTAGLVRRCLCHTCEGQGEKQNTA